MFGVAKGPLLRQVVVMTARSNVDVAAWSIVAAVAVAPIPLTASVRVPHPMVPTPATATAARRGIAAPVRLHTTGADDAPQGSTVPRTSLLDPTGTARGGPEGPVQLHGAVQCYLERQGFVVAFLHFHRGTSEIVGHSGEGPSEQRIGEQANGANHHDEVN